MGSGYSLGIDLGTTFTAAAVHRDGRTEIASLGNRAPSVPSLVFLREDQVILTGEAAERRGLSEPQRLAREFKRRVGDSAPIMLGDAPYSAERLMAALVRQVVAAVSEREGGPPERVAVSHPANWGPFKVDLTRHAVDLAGLRDVRLLSEPVAAAIYYASTERVEVGSVVAVYDLGGGTFDAAVLRKTATGFEALGEAEGIERLGGIDFDEAVLAHVRRAVGPAIDELDSRDPTVRSALSKLRQECVAAKEALSFDSETAIPVLLPNVQTEVRLTRAELEPMIAPALRETIEALGRAIDRSGVRPDDLDAILLVGGSSQIPLVAEMVSTGLGRPVAVDVHPKHSVALGAAIAAASLDGAGVATSPAGAGAAAPPAPTAVVPSPPAPSVPGAVPPVVPPEVAPTGRGTPPPSAPPRPVGGRRRAAAFAGLAAAAAVASFLVLRPDGADDTAGGAGASTTTTDDTGSATTVAPLTCAAAAGRCAAITQIELRDGAYVATYDVTGFDPLIYDPGVQGTPEDHHVHFFFDTTAEANAGSNGNPPGDWRIWDRPSGDGQLVFDALGPADRGTAERLCVAVADSAHAVETGSGSCAALPDVGADESAIDLGPLRLAASTNPAIAPVAPAALMCRVPEDLPEWA
jgi:actin-like ATPase involved in cell morphogenesis